MAFHKRLARFRPRRRVDRPGGGERTRAPAATTVIVRVRRKQIVITPEEGPEREFSARRDKQASVNVRGGRGLARAPRFLFDCFGGAHPPQAAGR
jgi:hypothetical protein